MRPPVRHADDEDRRARAPIAAPDIAWHAVPGAQVLAALDVDDAGLDAAEAARRLARYGPNRLALARPTSALAILWRQFQSFGVLLLLAAAAVAVASGDRVDGIVIGVVLLLNVSIGFATELRARRAMEALRGLESPWAVAVRDGRAARVDARLLVPGDVIELEAGMAVPADCRLLASTELRTVEATLTGESDAVRKEAAPALEPDRVLAERRNMVFGGTTVVAGVGRAIVVATGAATEVGRIGALASGIAEEPTPLERRLATLGWQLALVAVAVGGLVGVLAWLADRPLAIVLELGLAMAVAAVPEGLPAVVTITMAVGTHRMARRHALVRRLAAVETVGSTTVVCTDKTGTLTAGEQTVTAIWLEDRAIDVTGSGYDPAGDFRAADRVLRPPDEPRLLAFLRAAALASRGTLEESGGRWRAAGDPTDVAFLVAARKAGIDRDAERTRLPGTAELPFSSERMLMATFHAAPDGSTIAMVKGAPSRVLARCTRLRTARGDVPLDEPGREDVRVHDAALAARGLRVLAVACGRVGGANEPALEELTLLGLAGLTDPPAPRVPETIRALGAAGVRTIMLTGDQRGTAVAIARQLGVAESGDRELEGAEITRLSDGELRAAAARTRVFSRISPVDKLRVVSALRDDGEIVAMLGDGVNDAAALRRADIGIAMGKRGTDVAKDAAGLVLADDRFATVRAAIEEGRVIFDNIRKFVLYLVSCNLAEIAALVGAGAIGLPLPVTPLQILWLNLVTDSLPALALALEPAEENVMRRPPRDPRTGIVPPRLAAVAIAYAALIAGVTMAALAWGLRAWPTAPARAVTLSFTTLALAQLFHLGNARRAGPVSAPRLVAANRYALAALAITVALQVVAVSIPALARAIDAVPLDGAGWAVAVAFGLVPALVGQGAKLLRQAFRPPRLAPA